MMDADRVAGLVVKPGRSRTVILDPPWPFYYHAGRALADYAPMSLDEIAALPVASWSEDAAHLYLWTTNAHLACAVAFLAGWGFQYKTILTWVKPRLGLGDISGPRPSMSFSPCAAI